MMTMLAVHANLAGTCIANAVNIIQKMNMVACPAQPTESTDLGQQTNLVLILSQIAISPVTKPNGMVLAHTIFPKLVIINNKNPPLADFYLTHFL